MWKVQYQLAIAMWNLCKKIKNNCAHKVAKQQTTERLFFKTASVSSSGAQQCSTVSSHTTFSSDLRQWVFSLRGDELQNGLLKSTLFSFILPPSAITSKCLVLFFNTSLNQTRQRGERIVGEGCFTFRDYTNVYFTRIKLCSVSWLFFGSVDTLDFLMHIKMKDY